MARMTVVVDSDVLIDVLRGIPAAAFGAATP
jgi:hypothetical protein